jgi:NAD+ kinase
MRKRSGKAKSFAFVAAATEEAQAALGRLQRAYGEHDPEQADIVVALGGDGFMLETLHRFMGGPPMPGGCAPSGSR